MAPGPARRYWVGSNSSRKNPRTLAVRPVRQRQGGRRYSALYFICYGFGRVRIYHQPFLVTARWKLALRITPGASRKSLVCPGRKGMRIAALLVALFTIVIGIGGLISPESGTEIRRLYFATPVRLYTAGAVRVAMGLVVILSAAASRAPKTLRALGAVMCMQGLAATLMGPVHARAILEWETMQGTALLRVGAAVALAAGCFLAFAVTGHRPGNGAT
jgi:hypothetical protein